MDFAAEVEVDAGGHHCLPEFGCLVSGHYHSAGVLYSDGAEDGDVTLDNDVFDIGVGAGGVYGVLEPEELAAIDGALDGASGGVQLDGGILELENVDGYEEGVLVFKGVGGAFIRCAEGAVGVSEDAGIFHQVFGEEVFVVGYEAGFVGIYGPVVVTDVMVADGGVEDEVAVGKPFFPCGVIAGGGVSYCGLEFGEAGDGAEDEAVVVIVVPVALYLVSGDEDEVGVLCSDGVHHVSYGVCLPGVDAVVSAVPAGGVACVGNVGVQEVRDADYGEGCGGSRGGERKEQK